MNLVEVLSIKALAFRVLQEITSRSPQATNCPALDAPVGQAAVRPDSSPVKRGAQFTPCGSQDCAGCYDVRDGKKIHPPKSGEEYRNWLLRWEARGKIQ